MNPKTQTHFNAGPSDCLETQSAQALTYTEIVAPHAVGRLSCIIGEAYKACTSRRHIPDIKTLTSYHLHLSTSLGEDSVGAESQ